MPIRALSNTKVSPEVKVLLLDWRTYPEWRKSLETFALQLFAQLWPRIV